MAKRSKEAKKPGSAETDERRDRRSGDKPERRLKKAIDRPIGQPEQAHEEVPIGWDFGPEGQQSVALPDEGETPPNTSENVAEDVTEDKAEGETTTALADSSPADGSGEQARLDLGPGTSDVSADSSPSHSIGSGGVPSPGP